MLLQNRLIDFKEHPRTAEENAFLKLQARQDILERQLRDLTSRRDDLANNLEGRSGADKEGVETRLRSLDAQINATEIELGNNCDDNWCDSWWGCSDRISCETISSVSSF